MGDLEAPVKRPKKARTAYATDATCKTALSDRCRVTLTRSEVKGHCAICSAQMFTRRRSVKVAPTDSDSCLSLVFGQESRYVPLSLTAPSQGEI